MEVAWGGSVAGHGDLFGVMHEKKKGFQSGTSKNGTIHGKALFEMRKETHRLLLRLLGLGVDAREGQHVVPIIAR